MGSSTKRDTAVLTASWRISISTGSGLAGSATSDGSLDRFGHAHRAAAQQVERAVVRDAEQPGPKRRRLPSKLVQRHEGPGERVLHDILAVDDRSHQARAIAVQLGPQLAG